MRPDQEQFFEQLYLENFWLLNRYAAAHLNRGQAEEVVQDTFHKAVEKIDLLADHQNPGGWLMETLKNKIRNLKRTNQKELMRLISLDHESVLAITAPGNVENTVMQQDSFHRAVSAIEKVLSENELYILKRIVFDKMDYNTVSQEVGSTVWACQKRLERIRDKLGKLFPEYRKKK